MCLLCAARQASTGHSLSLLALQFGAGSGCSGSQGLVSAGLTEHAAPLRYKQGLRASIALTLLLSCTGEGGVVHNPPEPSRNCCMS